MTCRLAWADRSTFGSTLRNSPDQLLRAINVTMRDLKKGRAEELATPGKSFVFMNFGSFKKPTGDRKRYEAEKLDLWVNHRDVPLLMVGQGNSVDLKELAYHDNDIFETDTPDPEYLAKRIVERVCKTPVTIQHPKCWSETSSGSEVSGFITPGRKQYWAMYPEYFIKSFNVEFKVTFFLITFPSFSPLSFLLPLPDTNSNNLFPVYGSDRTNQGLLLTRIHGTRKVGRKLQVTQTRRRSMDHHFTESV